MLNAGTEILHACYMPEYRHVWFTNWSSIQINTTTFRVIFSFFLWLTFLSENSSSANFLCHLDCRSISPFLLLGSVSTSQASFSVKCLSDGWYEFRLPTTFNTDLQFLFLVWVIFPTISQGGWQDFLVVPWVCRSCFKYVCHWSNI